MNRVQRLTCGAGPRLCGSFHGWRHSGGIPIGEAAQILGINRASLWRKLKGRRDA